jgi:hypothetical protein
LGQKGDPGQMLKLWNMVQVCKLWRM